MAAVGLFIFLAIAVVVGAVIVLRIRAAAERREQDAAGQALLVRGLTAARSLFTDCGDWSCASPASLSPYDGSLVWNELPTDETRADQVSVRQHEGRWLVLVTLSEGDEPFCIADTASGPGAGTSYGRVDAATVDQCTGGWDPPPT